MPESNHLYFMLNPALATVKIGIATDVEVRRVTLERACGVPLVVLGVLKGGAQYERDLHDAFDADRLIGEWFTPSAALLALAEQPCRVASFVESNEAVIAGVRSARVDAKARRREERDEAERAEREELARLAAEEKRIERERAAAKKKRQAAAAKRERERLEAQRREAERQRAAFANKSPELRDRLIRSESAQAIEQRRSVVLASQRGRNAALLGVSPELN